MSTRIWSSTCSPDAPQAQWRILSGDVDWIVHGAVWFRQVQDTGVYWVVRCFDHRGDVGEDADTSPPDYRADLLRLDFGDISDIVLQRALSCIGVEHLDPEGARRQQPVLLLDACVSYGLGAPMGHFRSHWADRARAAARRAAEQFWVNPAEEVEALGRHVNALLTPAREYGAGRIFTFDP